MKAYEHEDVIRRNTGYFRSRPWWVGLKGSVIMVMTAPDVWETDVFLDYKENEYRKFVCASGSYAFARHLTTAERDAIKVQD